MLRMHCEWASFANHASSTIATSGCTGAMTRQKGSKGALAITNSHAPATTATVAMMKPGGPNMRRAITSR